MKKSVLSLFIAAILSSCGGEVVYADNDVNPIQPVKPAFYKPIFCDCEVGTDHNGQIINQQCNNRSVVTYGGLRVLIVKSICDTKFVNQSSLTDDVKRQ